MKKDVNYTLDRELRWQIAGVRDIIKSYLHNAQIYLFGSIAKGCYSKNSDIDLLILIPQEIEMKRLRILRHELEDRIEQFHADRDVDLKLYGLDRYKMLSEKPCFEQAIKQDLIDIEKW